MFRFTLALWRYRWLILCITSAGFGAGWSALPLIAPHYEARATLRVQAGDVRHTGLTLRAGPASSRSWSWPELLRTNAVLAPVVREFQLAGGSDAESEREAVESLAERLRVREEGGSGLLRVYLVGSDPERTATVLNAVVERLASVATDLKMDSLSALASILEKQRVRAEQMLREAEEELERFRMRRSRPVPPVTGLAVTQDSVLSMYWALTLEQEEIRTHCAALEQVLALLGDARLSLPVLLDLPAVRQHSPALAEALDELRERETALRELRQSHPPTAPQVEHALAAVVRLRDRTIPELAAALLDELRHRESALEERIRAAGEQLRANPRRSTQEDALKRRVATAERFYIEIQLRHESALLAEAGSMPDLRLLEPAVPPQRSLRSGSPMSFLVLVIVISLCVAVADAVLLGWLDRRMENAYRL